jgi:serine/threonine protein kinase
MQSIKMTPEKQSNSIQRITLDKQPPKPASIRKTQKKVSTVPKQKKPKPMNLDAAVPPQVVGEGTYGCVHKPSVHCNTRKNYTNKVSKFMKKTDAETELNEYEKIAKIDKKKKFYLGKPSKCSLSKGQETMDAIQKCKLIDKNFKSLTDYSLLIMEDGGINLEQFGEKVAEWKVTPENTEKIEHFWIEAQRILYGLKVFIDNDIVHHDLKPQNIVYNEKQNRLNFIDFGLMDTKTNIIQLSKNSKNELAHTHWSFPFEFPFLNFREYNFVANDSNAHKNYYVKELFTDKTTEEYKHMSIFFTYVQKNDIKSIVTDFLNTVINDVVPGQYKYMSFLEKSVRTIDVYGTGIAFVYLLHKTSHLLDKPLVLEFDKLFSLMITAHLPSRIEPDDLLTRYEDILFKHGLLKKYDLRFKNHILKPGKLKIPKTLQNIDSSQFVISKEEFEKTVTKEIEPPKEKMD